MLFNENEFNKYFLKVIQETPDAFPFCVLRQERTIDPNTRSVSMKYRLADEGIGNWASPKEGVEYELEGVIEVTNCLIFVPAGTDVMKKDLIFRYDRKIFYRVIETTDYISHIDLQCVSKEVGMNFAPLDNPTPNDIILFLNSTGTII